MTPMVEVTVSTRAATFAGKHGSQIFVWVAPSGLARVSTTPPSPGELMRWDVRSIDTLTVFVEEGIQIDWLRIVLRLLSEAAPLGELAGEVGRRSLERLGREASTAPVRGNTLRGRLTRIADL